MAETKIELEVALDKSAADALIEISALQDPRIDAILAKHKVSVTVETKADQYERGARDALEEFKAYFSDEDGNYIRFTEWTEEHWDVSAEGAVADLLRQKKAGIR